MIILRVCNFSYGHLFLVSIFYQLTSEKNQVHTGNLTHCKQTLQLIKFHLIKNMKGKRRNWLVQFKFPLSSILLSFLLPWGKVYSFPHPLSSVHLFAFLTILTNVANKCKEHIKCIQLLTL